MDLLCGCGGPRSERSFRHEFFGRIVTERPREAARVSRRAKEVARSVERVVDRGFEQDSLQPTTALLACRRLAANAEPSREPVPQSRQEGSTPSAQAAPALRIGHDAETTTDFALADALDEVKLERFENDAGGVPAARVKLVGKHADRVAAAPTEVAPHVSDGLAGDLDDAEHLPAVRAVSDDAETLTGRKREFAAKRTARRAQGIDRRKPRPLEEPLDVLDE